MSKSAQVLLPFPYSSSDNRATIKCQRAVADRFFAAAAVHGLNANDFVNRLMDAAAALASTRTGSIGELTDQLAKLQAKQGDCADALVELCELLCSLNARLDDGLSVTNAFLSEPRKGGVR